LATAATVAFFTPYLQNFRFCFNLPTFEKMKIRIMKYIVEKE